VSVSLGPHSFAGEGASEKIRGFLTSPLRRIRLSGDSHDKEGNTENIPRPHSDDVDQRSELMSITIPK
jgi:hypothetical protein